MLYFNDEGPLPSTCWCMSLVLVPLLNLELLYSCDHPVGQCWPCVSQNEESCQCKAWEVNSRQEPFITLPRGPDGAADEKFKWQSVCSLVKHWLRLGIWIWPGNSRTLTPTNLSQLSSKTPCQEAYWGFGKADVLLSRCPLGTQPIRLEHPSRPLAICERMGQTEIINIAGLHFFKFIFLLCSCHSG